jgi:hypothetical protein
MWRTGDEEVREESVGVGEVRVNGETIEVDAGSSFVDTILELAREMGVDKFKVVLNGREVEADSAPETIEEGDIINLVKFEDPA